MLTAAQPHLHTGLRRYLSPRDRFHYPLPDPSLFPLTRPLQSLRTRPPIRESARIPRGSGSLPRRECQRTAAWRTRGPAAQTRQGESAQIPRRSGSLSRRECQRTAAWIACSPGCADPPEGKCPDSPWKRFTSPEGMPEDSRLRECQRTAAWISCSPGCADPPGGKRPDSP